jgi:hypothetical protein
MQKNISLPVSLVVGALLVALAVGFVADFLITYDQDTDYRIGVRDAYFEKSASQSSPIAKCKQRQTGLEAIIASKTAQLSRVSDEVRQLRAAADDTAERFRKEGTIRVQYASSVRDCERLYSSSSMFAFAANQDDPSYERRSRSHLCSSLLDEQLRNVEEKRQEYSELQKAVAQTSDELDQLGQECFSVKK